MPVILAHDNSSPTQLKPLGLGPTLQSPVKRKRERDRGRLDREDTEILHKYRHDGVRMKVTAKAPPIGEGRRVK